MLRKYFPLVWGGLWRRKARTLLTLASLTLAFLLIGLLQAVNSVLSGGAEFLRLREPLGRCGAAGEPERFA